MWPPAWPERRLAALWRATPVLVVCGCAGVIVLGAPLYACFLPMLLALGVSSTQAGGRAVLALVVALLAPFRSAPTHDRWVLLGLISALVWTACRWWARTREQQAHRASAERAAAAAAAVYDERLRIARDLHDMVSHGMSVITIQAQYGALVARHDPAAAEGALHVVEDTGRETLRQLRQMVDVLRRPSSTGLGPDPATDPDSGADVPTLTPAPGVGDLADLLARTAAGGLRVDCVTSGDLHRIPPDVGLCVYRVVQEGVANVLQHSGADRADLLVQVTEDAVHVRLTNGPATTRPVPAGSGGSGHGLVGIRERLHLLGGCTRAGATPDGGYALEVDLPVVLTPHVDSLSRLERT